MISSIYSECFSSHFIFVLTQLTVYFSLILFSFFHIFYCSSLSSYFYSNFYTRFSRTEMIYPLSLLDSAPYTHWVWFRTGFNVYHHYWPWECQQRTISFPAWVLQGLRHNLMQRSVLTGTGEAVGHGKFSKQCLGTTAFTFPKVKKENEYLGGKIKEKSLNFLQKVTDIDSCTFS